MDTKMRGVTFTCAIDTALSAWIAVAPRNLCPEILVVGLPIPACVVFLILYENIRGVLGGGFSKVDLHLRKYLQLHQIFLVRIGTHTCH
jgi:hypothetical protein